MDFAGKYLNSEKRSVFVILCVVLVFSFFVNSSYRGIAHDEGISNFDTIARRILAHEPIYSDSEGGTKAPARLIYIWLTAIGYKIFGFNLVALHIFPYVLQIINPCLLFIVIYQLYKNSWWGLGGALLFIFHPFNVIYLNQAHNHPIFVFFLLIMLLLLMISIKNPKLLILLGIVASLLLFTRFTSGVIFVVVIYTVYIIQRWNTSIPLKWIVLSFSALLLTYLVFVFYFGFPLLYLIDYFPDLLRRQAEYKAEFSFYELTRLGFKMFTSWYFCGKFIAPFLVLLVILGAVSQIRQRIFYPTAMFLPHFLFFFFVFPGRHNVIHLMPATFSVTGFILLLLHGIYIISHYLTSLAAQSKRKNLLGKFLQNPVLQKAVDVLMILVILGFFGRSTYTLSILQEEVIPSSNMWRIVKYNPPLPGHPLFKETSIQLSQEQRFPVMLREYLYKTVLGNYRSWYLYEIGKYAFDHKFPKQARESADFFYFDDYTSEDKWKTTLEHLEGDSPLWTDEYPGRIGAFPVGRRGSFVYKFDFPRPVDMITIADIHTQWGPGDVTKMWTSPDGEHWVLRYDNSEVRFTKDYYYQFFEDEFEGQRSLFVKYFFLAGDKTRTDDDNRGASLEEFSLAVTYQK